MIRALLYRLKQWYKKVCYDYQDHEAEECQRRLYRLNRAIAYREAVFIRNAHLTQKELDEELAKSSQPPQRFKQSPQSAEFYYREAIKAEKRYH